MALRAGALLACVLGLLVTAPATTQTQEVEYTASGRGVTLDEAIEQALFEVARQANGTRIEASQASSVHTFSGSVSGHDGETSAFEFQERTDSQVRTSARGLVSGYRILGQQRTARGFEVTLRATVPRYRVPGIDSGNRRRLAVIPFGSRVAQAEFFGPQAGHELASELSRAVVAQFVQGRRFAVLDRESWGAIGDERALLASADTPIGEKARLGMALGADYLILGELLEAEGGVRERQQRLTGVRSVSTDARIAVAYRIVVPATGEVKYADVLELGLDDRDGRPLPSRSAALAELSRRMVGIAVDRIYPMKVVNVVSPTSAVLNQGGSTLAVGDRLQLFEEGAAMVDPYTREPLGRVETAVGQLQVVRVDGKVAYADLVEGSGVLREGLLARRDLELYDAAWRPDPVPPPSPRAEGVRLPFDR